MKEVHISFDNEKQMKIFVKWFQQAGWPSLTICNFNTQHGDDQLSCLCADDKTDWGHYFEIQ